MLTGLVQPVAATVIVAVAAFGFGFWVPGLLPARFTKTSRLIYSCLGGFGLLGAIVFLVGLWSLSRATILTMLAAGVALAVLSWHRERPEISIQRARGSAVPMAIVGVVLAITAVAGLARPIGDVGTDGIAYHLAGPKVWLRDGVIHPLADNAPTAYPAVAESVFAVLMSIGGPSAPAFSAVFTLMLFLALAGEIARRSGLNVTGAWWVAALLAAMPAVYRGAHSEFVDVTYASFVLAAASVALDAVERRHFVAVGLFCGLAMATKYTGLTATPLVLIVAFWPWRRRAAGHLFGNVLTTIGTAAIVALPVYLRNWIVLGTPIYPPPPGALAFVHPRYLSADAVREFYAYNLRRGAGHGSGVWSFLALPFNLTYHAADFNGAGGIGLAPLGLGVLGLVAPWRNDFARRLAAIGLLLLIAWFATMQESRFLIHVYTISTVFAVIGWERGVAVWRRRGRFAAGVLVAVSVAYGLLEIGDGRLADLHAAVSPSYASARRQQDIPFIESLDIVNHDPSATRLLVLDPTVPVYYVDGDYLRAFGQYGEQAVPGAATPAEVLAQRSALGISHVLDVRSPVSGFVVPTNDPGLGLVFERPNQRLYRVIARTSSRDR